MPDQNLTENLDENLIDKIRDIDFQPIFIQGVERSGTSILYTLLASTNNFNALTAYHIINYSELIYNFENNKESAAKTKLAEFFNSVQKDRCIDKLKIMPDFAEEYRFLLDRKKGLETIQPDTISLFNEICKKIQYISDKNKPLLLKNPPDFSNFLYIKSILPNAKFIFIHRNPLNTLHSQLRAMRSLLENKSEYMALMSPGYGKVFDKKLLLSYYRFMYSDKVSIRATSAVNKLADSANKFLQDITKLDKNCYTETFYEKLCSNPNTEISTIFDFLQISNENQDYSAYVKPRKTAELKELEKLKKKIDKKLKNYIEYCGY